MVHSKQHILAFVLIGFLLTSCASHLKLKNLDSERSLKGRYDTLYNEVTVSMPNGEILAGKCRPAAEHPFPFAKEPKQPDAPPRAGFGSGVPHGLHPDIYALLTSEKSNLVMEVFLGYDSFRRDEGFGFARTNDKRSYKIKY